MDCVTVREGIGTGEEGSGGEDHRNQHSVLHFLCMSMRGKEMETRGLDERDSTEDMVTVTSVRGLPRPALSFSQTRFDHSAII